MDQPATGTAQLHICLLGGVRMRRGSTELSPGPPQRRAVLALLALAGGQPVARDEMVDVLWPDAPPPRAINIVQTHVKHLRHALEPARPSRAASTLLPSVGGGYALRVDPTAVDALCFRGMVAGVREARRVGDHARAWRVARDAVRVWQTPLPDVPVLVRHPRVVALLAEWQLVLTWYADAAVAQGRADEVLPLLEEQARSRPLDEQIQVCLLRAYGALGRRADAFAFYDEARRRLATELGVNAGQSLVTAYEALLRQDSAPAPAHDGAIAAANDVAEPDPPEGPTRQPPVPAQLPADLAAFAGRVGEMAHLDDLLPDVATSRPVAVVVTAIAGTAGVGKTALAIHWAHRTASRFPDGQLYVNLRGYAPGPATSPLQALAQLLQGLGVEADKVPVDLDVAAGLCRSLLDGKRVLIVLDNAAGAEQVRPLLPGSPTCLTLVTSRDRLTGLVASHGAQRLTLDVLTPDEAVDLLGRIAGEGRITAEPEAAAELAAQCAHLPLALRIAAANLTVRPDQPIAAYVAALRRGDVLSGLTVDGDAELAVRAAFDLSYQRLAVPAQRLFRLLGVVPGQDFGVAAAAAVADVTVEQAGGLLDRLAAAHLLAETAPGRFAFHDLLRRYAAEHAQAESGREWQVALHRLLEWYLRSADAADRLLYGQMLRLPLPSPDAGSPLPAAFVEAVDALDWLDTERSNLVAAVERAAGEGPRPLAWRLCDALRGYFWQNRHTVDWLAVTRAGLAAAQQEGDAQAQAAVQRTLGLALYCLGDYAEAVEHYTCGLALAKQAGWVSGNASMLGNLGLAYTDMGRLELAADHHAQALALYRQSGETAGQAIALANLGDVHREMGRPQRAADPLRLALTLHTRAECWGGVASTLNTLAEVVRDLGRLDDARQHLTRALALARDLGNRYSEAHGLYVLATVHRDAGRQRQALESARAALTVAREIGEPRTEADTLNTLGSVYLRQGSAAQSTAHHREALDLAQQSNLRYPEAEAFIGLAAAALHGGRHTDAITNAGWALAIAREVGYRILEGHACIVLAAAELACDRHDQATAHARTALAMHHESGHRLGEADALTTLGDIVAHTGGRNAAEP
jgi:DNA-binding SARP family transcriptional activator